MADLKVVPKMSRAEAIRLRAGGRMFLAFAESEPDKVLALENRRVGNAAIAKAEEALRQLDAWQRTGARK